MATLITKNSSTASSVPTAAQLVQGELAVNVTDKRLFTENASGTVVELGTNPSSLALPNGSANGVAYLNGSKVLTTGSALTFTGTRLGIGEASPVNALTVKSGNGDQVTINNAGERFTQFTLQNNGTSKGALWVDNTNSLLELFGYSGMSLTFSANGSEAMRLTSTGLGIGTTSPLTKIHAMSSASSVTFALSPNSSNTNIAYLTNDATYISLGSSVGSTGVKFRVALGAPDNAATIDSSGNLLVGTTSASANVTASDNTAGNAYYIAAGIGSTVGLASTAKNDYALQLNRQGNTDGVIAGFRRNGTFVGNISVTGSATAYNTSSDYRLKENIAPMTGALAKVQALKPCTYNWKADGSDGEGFIAHELAEVVPGCVTGEKDAVDENDNPVYQGIDTSFLVATLTAAIQELKAEFDAYKASHP